LCQPSTVAAPSTVYPSASIFSTARASSSGVSVLRRTFSAPWSPLVPSAWSLITAAIDCQPSSRAAASRCSPATSAYRSPSSGRTAIGTIRPRTAIEPAKAVTCSASSSRTLSPTSIRSSAISCARRAVVVGVDTEGPPS
jgi:hypothetical protein